jgi:hypothetical protein
MHYVTTFLKVLLNGHIWHHLHFSISSSGGAKGKQVKTF